VIAGNDPGRTRAATPRLSRAAIRRGFLASGSGFDCVASASDRDLGTALDSLLPMGSFPKQFAVSLRDRLGLVRAIETGTFNGATARMLSGMFQETVTIERSADYHQRAAGVLADIPNVRQIHGHSADELGPVAREGGPTLYWLDAHWSGMDTAGSDDPAPVVREIDAIGAGDPRDCIIIDDARDFAANADERWPALLEIADALRRHRPDAHVTVVHDLIVSVPAEAKDVVDEFGRAHAWTVWEAGERARGVRFARFNAKIHPMRAWVGRKLGR
jgi:hypothetical protein